MIIIHFYGLDMFLVGELNEKIHSKVAKVFNVAEEDVIFSASDSFVFYKGHEQTSFNLFIKVECPVRDKQYEKEVADLLLGETKDYSVHTRILFSYYQENNYYERINEEYPEYIVGGNDVEDTEYDETKEYGEDDIYLGNVFDGQNLDAEEREDDQPIKPFNLNDFFKK